MSGKSFFKREVPFWSLIISSRFRLKSMKSSLVSQDKIWHSSLQIFLIHDINSLFFESCWALRCNDFSQNWVQKITYEWWKVVLLNISFKCVAFQVHWILSCFCKVAPNLLSPCRQLLCMCLLCTFKTEN